LNENSEGRGLAGWRKSFEHEISYKVLPSSTVFTFAVSDNADRRDKAETLAAWAGALKTLLETQVIKPEQALNVLVDGGYLPRDFLASDETSGGTLGDNDKLVSGSDTSALPSTDDDAPPIERSGTLRERLAAIRANRKQFESRVKANGYLNAETYVNVPPSTLPRSAEDIRRLMQETNKKARARYRSVAGVNQ
jgi:hypothetical protein